MWMNATINHLQNQGKRRFCSRWQFWHTLHLVLELHVQQVPIPELRGSFSPRSPNMLINWGKYRRSREAWRHYIKTELLDFLLKTCCQMPIIRVPKAPLHFFSPHALQQTLLCEQQECAVLAWSSLSMCFQRNFLVFLGYSHARRKEKQW